MIDLIFASIMGTVGNILAFFIVLIIVGGLILLPFALNGGWVLALVLYPYLIGIVISAWMQAKDEKEKENNKKENG